VTDFREEASRLASLAAEIMEKRTGTRPDYSEASLQIVEETLDETSKQLHQLTGAEIDGLVQQFGCYILEVGRKEFDGVYQWYVEGNQPALVVVDGTCQVALLAWDRVRSRLNGDLGDNIPFFYEGFASRVRLREPGTRATYV
jgi:hypothetical protein